MAAARFPRFRPVAVAAALGAALSLIVTGCSPSADPEPSGGFPVTIEQAFGTTVVPEQPQRIVTLIDDEFVIALGVQPVGMSRNPFSASGLSPIVDGLIVEPAPELLDVSGGNPYDQIAALEPDLIIGGVTQEDYDQLARIAPTLPYVGSSTTDTWQERQLVIGTALGLEAEAEAVIAETEAAIAEIRDANPDLAGTTFSLALVFEPGLVSVIRAPEEPIVALFGDLGLELAEPSIALTASDLSGRATIGLESLDALDADHILISGIDPALLAQVVESPVFAALIAEGKAHVVELPIDLIFSLARPSSLNAEPGLTRLVAAIAGG